MSTNDLMTMYVGIWKVLAPMLDPVVRAKVQMTKTTEVSMTTKVTNIN